METHFEVVSPSLHEGGQGESRQNSLLQETLDSSGDTVNAAAAYLAELHSGDSRRAVRSRLNIAAPPMPSAASGGGFAMCMCLGLCMHWPIKKAWPPLQSMHISRHSKGWRKRPGGFDRST